MRTPAFTITIALLAVSCDYAAGTRACEPRFVTASSLLIRTQPSANAARIGVLPEGALVQTCRTENKETIGGLTDVWHEVDGEKQGFVFGAYLATPSDEVYELQDGATVRMVYAEDRFSRVYVLDATQKPVCRFEYEYGEPIMIVPSPAGTFVLISPGTGAVR